MASDIWSMQWRMVWRNSPQPGDWIIRRDEAMHVGAVMFDDLPKHHNDNERR